MRSCGKSRPRSGQKASSWASASPASPKWSARARASTTTSPGCGCSTRRSCACIPTGKAILKLGVKTQGQGHETTFAQIVAEELGIPAADIEVQEGDTDNTPFGLGPTHRTRRLSAGPPPRWCRASCATRANRSPPISSRPTRPISSSTMASSSSRARPRTSRPSRTSPLRRTRICPMGWRRGSRA